jgi:hypothetical protein
VLVTFANKKHLAWTVALATSTACASILGVDHDYALGDVDPGVRCADGGTFCEASSQLCCLHATEGYSECVTGGPGSSPCQGWTPIYCDTPADCRDPDLGACCILLNDQTYLLQTQCQASCPDAGLWYTACDPNASPTCAPGTTCKSLSVGEYRSSPEWWHACQ